MRAEPKRKSLWKNVYPRTRSQREWQRENCKRNNEDGGETLNEIYLDPANLKYPTAPAGTCKSTAQGRHAAYSRLRLNIAAADDHRGSGKSPRYASKGLDYKALLKRGLELGVVSLGKQGIDSKLYDSHVSRSTPDRGRGKSKSGRRASRGSRKRGRRSRSRSRQ
jgi:hypothetical protein